MSSLGTLQATTHALLTSNKGLLAIDESLPTIRKRFGTLAIASTEDNRSAYRELLVTTPGLSEYISGAILFDETLRQHTSSGASFAELLNAHDIIPGIKVDRGTVALPAFPEEKLTEGLDGLRERLEEYRSLGARFTKWRAVISIGEDRPTTTCIEANAQALAAFAAFSQEADLVPVVEPEVLMDGPHSLERCEDVMTTTLRAVFSALADFRVWPDGMLLKTAMVLSGADCPHPASPVQTAAATLRCLRRTVPASVQGIVFLSGGQTEPAATTHLNAICAMGGTPWKLRYSFGRALQDSALRSWRGSSTHVASAQAALLHRARCNSLAVRGAYTPIQEAEVVAEPTDEVIAPIV